MMMPARRRLFSLLLLYLLLLGAASALVLLQQAQAQELQRFYIAPEHRVSLPGACLWNSIESVGRAHGYTQVHGIARNRLATGDGVGTESLARSELLRRGVPYTLQPAGTYDRAFLTRSSTSGAIVTVRSPDPTRNHSIVVIGFPVANTLEFWDSSAPNRIMTGPYSTFVKNWRGNVLSIHRRASPAAGGGR